MPRLPLILVAVAVVLVLALVALGRVGGVRPQHEVSKVVPDHALAH